MEVSELRKSPRRKNFLQKLLQGIWQILLLIPESLKKLWNSTQSIWKQRKSTRRRIAGGQFFTSDRDRHSSFLLGLNNRKDLETLSNANFLQLISWGTVNQVIPDPVVFSTDELSTELLLKEIKWDIDTVPSKTIVIDDLEPASETNYLFGLEDIEGLEDLLTQDLLQLVEWETDRSANLVAEEEDLHLLEDLLVNFPE